MDAEAGTLPQPIAAPAGLAGVVVAETAIGDVRPDEGLHLYRGYSALDLAARAPFEAVWHLMALGRFPEADELRSFSTATAALRDWSPPPFHERDHGREPPPDPLGDLVIGLTTVGRADRIPPLYDRSDRSIHDALRLAAVAPAIVAAGERRRRGERPIAPDRSLGHVADYLRMLSGVTPGAEVVDALTTYLVLTVDHGFNASTFATRVVASTGASLTASLIAGIGALSGPLHGGAPSRVLDVLDGIGDEDGIGPWVSSAIRKHERIMGFGHAVYRGPDPRAERLREVALRMGGPRVRLALAFEREVVQQLAIAKPERPLAANVELWAAVVLEQCRIPRTLFTATFAIARIVGWAAHALEQADQRKIIRPSSRYVGPPRSPLPASLAHRDGLRS